MPIIDLEEMKLKKMTIKGRITNAFQAGKRKVIDGIEWCKENPRDAAMLLGSATTILAGANKVIRGVNRHVTARKERYTKERFIYDHSMNAYLETKRKLTSKDIQKIDNIRRSTGKRMSEVLADLNLLK